MSKKDKTLIIICVIALVILLPIYVIVTNYKHSAVVELVYPEGQLSDSLFVSQNSTYTKIEQFPDSYELKTSPYIIDLPSGSAADVNNSHIVKATETIYMYVSEHDATQSAESLFLSEFPSAIMMDFSPLYTYSQALKSQSGYINGFGADYKFYMVNISNGEKTTVVYAALYDLEQLTYENYTSKITIAVVTTNQDSNSFASTKTVLDSAINTLRYDSKLDKRLQEALNKAAKEEEKEKEETKIEDDKPEEHQIVVGNPQTLIMPDDFDAKVAEISVEGPYTNCEISLTQEIPYESSIVTLYDSNYNELGNGTVSEDGLITTFTIGPVEDGVKLRYVIKITNYSAIGRISIMKNDTQGENNE